jgi:hypothetical protein
MIWFLVERRPPRGTATLLSHSDETLGTRSIGCTNRTPRMSVNRRRYGTAMQIPAATRGTVDHGGSKYGPEKFEGFARVQTRSTNLVLTGRQSTDGTGLCSWEVGLGRRGIWNITQTFDNRDPIRGLVALARE